MTIKEILENKENEKYNDQIIQLLSNILSLSKMELLLRKNEMLNEIQYQELEKQINLLKSGKPVQYIIGNVDFFGTNVIVNENVLIPRFETEELVENVYKYIIENNLLNANVLDLCCGSGAIGLSLKNKIKTLNVTLSDISDGALEVTRKNSKLLGLDVNIVKSDLLKDINDKYDIIVSNPPYIMIDEEIEDIVKNNEPHLALYAGIDGLDCYRKILMNIEKNLNKNYLVAFEIGYSQKNEIFELIDTNLKKVTKECKKDLSNRDRMIFIKNNLN